MKLKCSIPYTVPKLHRQIFKNEVDCLVLLEVLEGKNESEWGSSYTAQPKSKTD